MRQMSRREFLDTSGRAAASVPLAAMAINGLARSAGADDASLGAQEGATKQTGDASQQAAQVPMAVEYKPRYLTWVAATTGCLKALGIACDEADVAGYSGYAFLINVADGMHPSGPTAFDWGLLLAGVPALGRSALVFRGAHCCCELKQRKSDAYKNRVREEMRAAYDLVAREVTAGRPCVLWGTYDPDFGIAVGVNEGSYIVKTWKPYMNEPEPPIPFDGLTNPSGAYVLAFPTAVDVPRDVADRDALHHAVTMLNYRTGNPQYSSGLAAYDRWIACLEAGAPDPHGNSFTVRCWGEARRLAREFLSRVSVRNKAAAAPLGQAVRAYGQVADALGEVAGLFPFRDPEEKVRDAGARAAAIKQLRAAKAAEGRAALAVADAAARWKA